MLPAPLLRSYIALGQMRHPALTHPQTTPHPLCCYSRAASALDTRNPSSKLMLTILAGEATWEREIMLESSVYRVLGA